MKWRGDKWNRQGKRETGGMCGSTEIFVFLGCFTMGNSEHT